MRNIERTIEEVRSLRGDLSNFLIHLTRSQILQWGGVPTYKSAKDLLANILTTNILYGLQPIGQFSHKSFQNVQKKDLLAVCLTETPIDQIYLFVGIKGRALNFESYGLAFDVDKLSKAPARAAPVMYFSQPDTRDFHFVDVIKKIETSHYQDFKDILYLFDRFGKNARGIDYNFRWEREWRIKEKLPNVKDYVRFGLCPEYDIDYFEKTFAPIVFVDPFFHPKQIETKLKLAGVI